MEDRRNSVRVRVRVRGVARGRRARRVSVRSLGVLLREMPLHVQGEVVASSERALAHRALEWLRAGVLSIVTSQFVAPGEPPFAFWPLTLVRFFTCN